MTTSFQSLSQASAFATDVLMESARASSIAKPQKAFAVAFAVLAAALAGCASGLGANTSDTAAMSRVVFVDEGTVLGQSIGHEADFAYTIRLPSGELVSVAQAGDYAIPTGTPVLIEFGAKPRVIPQQGR